MVGLIVKARPVLLSSVKKVIEEKQRADLLKIATTPWFNSIT